NTDQYVRNIVIDEYENVNDETRIIKFTEDIPNDTVMMRPEINDETKEKIKDAFIAIGKDEEGRKIIQDIYSPEGYVESKDSNFDIVREYEEKVSEEIEQ